MSDDLIKRLRGSGSLQARQASAPMLTELEISDQPSDLCLEAANRIAELEAERDSIRDETLEEAARQCAIQGLINTRELEQTTFDVRSWNAAVVKCRDAIRALKGTKQ